MSRILFISMYMMVGMKTCWKIRSSSRSMASGGLVRVSPLGEGIKDGTVDIADYEGQPWPKVPIAIPSKGRESEVCQQTLKMLRTYEYDMSKVHIFVDATHFRKDGANEYDVYFKYLRDHGFAEVNVHPGGVGLRKQYEWIFAFFKDEPEIILTSDTVPRIDWRRRQGNVSVEPLPTQKLIPVIRIGFDICRIHGARAWSLSSCKAGLNLRPGTISRKCGLLCGNFCGIRLNVGPPPHMTVSDFTTDVEFSLRCWDQDGVMVRFLGIAAAHKYRSPGGHKANNPDTNKRHRDTCKAIETLANTFPASLKYTGGEERATGAMKYRFLQKGPKALTLKGTFEARGRKPGNGWRHMTGKERVRLHRLRKRRQNKTTRKK